MKKDRLLITISDVNKTKTYNVSAVIKKILLWIILVVVSVVSISFITISNLTEHVSALSKEREIIKTQNEKYSHQIKAKINQIKELGDQLENIEEIIGINKDEDSTSTLIQRATLAKITSAQKVYMLQTIPSGCPLKECIVTSKFGWRKHPTLGKKQYHKGLDLRAARRTPVYATADGVVRYVQDKNKGTFGRVVIISHNFGFETVYGHLRFTGVKIGDVIQKGDQIARSGNSGRSNGPHLHYEIHYASKLLDPSDYIKWDLKHYDEIFKKQRRVKWESLVKMINNQSRKLEQQ
jgi:murein DD-endopeptidase MepM/ murein hydrolase activator NlpD